ncbi:hypothetical protein KCP78_22895 [Salmonella enterica subsp. enterica]|nr:hypothetical protein KCP78_22895 [Salmonella enterica subsp. enterica]
MAVAGGGGDFRRDLRAQHPWLKFGYGGRLAGAEYTGRGRSGFAWLTS